MLDPLKLAQQKLKLSEFVKNAQTTNSTDIVDRANKALSNIQEGKVQLPKSLDVPTIESPELPIQSDPELLKKEAEARAQTIKAEAEELLQQKKEEELTKLKDRAESLVAPLGPLVGLFIKLPLSDPKFLAYISYIDAKKKMRELKQKASKENLKKSKEAYTFPMKPPTRFDLGELPSANGPQTPSELSASKTASDEPLGTRVISENGCTVTVQTVSANLSLDGARIEAQNRAIEILRRKGCVLTTATVISVIELKSVPSKIFANRSLAISTVRVEGK